MSKISIEQFAILADSAPTETSRVKLETQVEFKIAEDNRLVAAIIQFIFMNGLSPFMKLDVSCSFSIKPEDWEKMTQQDGRIILPKGFLCHMAMHTVGTARGILHCKTESTPFNSYIIPPINIEQIILDDIVIPAR